MKKFAIALALALPMVFASCEKNEDENDPKDLFAMPVMEWNASQETVKGLVDTTEFELDEANSDAETLVYQTIDTTFPDNLPWYIYLFENDALYASSLVIPTSADDDFTTWLVANGYTTSEEINEALADNENQIVYINGSMLTFDTICVYSFSEDYKNMMEGTFIYVGDDTKATKDIKALAAKASAKVSAIVANK